MSDNGYVTELRAAVDGISWFHRIDLGEGIVTPGLDVTAAKIARIELPDDLSGCEVLDIGAWDGAFSFEAERRGAKRVLATDSFIWRGEGWGSKAGFELARRALGSAVEDHEVDVMDLDPSAIGTFDVVMFLGVLYHLRHPLLGLERVASVTKPGGLVIVETHVDLLQLDRPAIALYPSSELGGDGTNWCGPNVPGLLALLEMAGFASAHVHGESPAAPPDAGPVHAGRVVVHARR